MASLTKDNALSHADNITCVVTPAPTTTDSTSTASTATKKRSIRVSNAWGIVLFKAVSAVDAHFAPHGEAQNRFEEALSLLNSSVPAGCFAAVAQPTCKTLNERFKKIIGDHREAVKKNRIASGIIEVRVERETLLDDLMFEVDAWEAKRAERDDRTELDRRLLKAGEDRRARALSRLRPSGSSDIGVMSNGGEENDSPRLRKRQKRANPPDSDGEEVNLISEHINSRKELEEKRLNTEERRLELEVQKEEREVTRLERAHENEAKRIAVDEKRVELEKRRLAIDSEEQKGTIAERKKVLSILGALVKKLQ